MAISHIQPAQVVNLHELQKGMPLDKSVTLFKSDALEVARLVLTKGQAFPTHQVAGEITVQCLTGQLTFIADDDELFMQAGDWLYLEGGVKHSLSAHENATLLLTISFP